MRRGAMTVEQTADEVASRKLHCVSHGYLQDDFAHLFTRDRTYLNSPLMNRGYWFRTRMVETALHEFMKSVAKKHHEGSDQVKCQVIVLGAGYDTLFFRMASPDKNSPSINHEGDEQTPSANLLGSSSCNLARFIEVDLPRVVTTKRSLIQQHPELSFASSEHSPYRLVSADLRSTEAVASQVLPLLDPHRPTFILSEFLLAYLSKAEGLALLSQFVQFVGDSVPIGLVAYDPIRPDTPYGRIMLQSLTSQGLALPGLQGLPSVEAHVGQYQQAGFTHVRFDTVAKLSQSIPDALRRQLHQVEILDDIDEWNLVLGHYVMGIALRGLEEFPWVLTKL